MIRYLLDTDVTSQAGRAKPNRNVQAWLKAVGEDELAISVITLRERLQGVEAARQKGASTVTDLEADVEDLAAAFRGRILAIDDGVARHWALLLTPDKSKSDDKAQVAIAAANGLTLVTLNWRDVIGLGVPVLNPGRKPPKLYEP
jgi:predicted nucleic acid-binding protein